MTKFVFFSLVSIQVVPLVQTFGHMEFVLKHGKFRHLREVLEYPNSLRPMAADTGELGGGVAELVKEMILQVREGAWISFLAWVAVALLRILMGFLAEE